MNIEDNLIDILNRWVIFMKETLIIIIIALIVSVGGYFAYDTIKNAVTPQEPSTGSVMPGGEYFATSTELMTNTLLKADRFQQVLLTGWDSTATTTANPQGQVTQATYLGNITITSTTRHALEIWNATSTAAINGGRAVSNLVFTLATGTEKGTYEFDAILTKGLVIQLGANFGGYYVITYR